MYLTYNGNESDVKFNNDGIIVLGCGSYRIGSSVEFDWCAVNCVNTIKKNNKYSIIINYNPKQLALIMMLQIDYILKNIFRNSLDIYNLEKALDYYFVGGQTPNTIALDLAKNNINRHKFQKYR